MDNKVLGTLGEDTAAKLLSCKGYRIIARNYRCMFGEIDIIAYRGGCLHFIEVKTRQTAAYGRPCESVNSVKQGRIRKAAVFYLKELKAAGIT
ncbi:MAG: YraN family protein, partial [Firmicutes bacterium]|nr:YraN family protein [Bacillota bacterium]